MRYRTFAARAFEMPNIKLETMIINHFGEFDLFAMRAICGQINFYRFLRFLLSANAMRFFITFKLLLELAFVLCLAWSSLWEWTLKQKNHSNSITILLVTGRGKKMKNRLRTETPKSKWN